MKCLQLLLMRASLISVLTFVSGISLADSIRLATTTSTYNSGLLDDLLSHYAQVSDTEVLVIAVGTGKALKMAENGDVDLVMTHAPAAEARFLDQGFGIEAHGVMYNDFVIVGPKEDSAKISGADLTASKPHPEIFEKAAILGNISKENCIVIEDSDNGVKAANDAGIFVFGYKNPMAEDQTLENANFVIDDFKELKAMI
jgi:ABC-type tungstate transport system permease subunit